MSAIDGPEEEEAGLGVVNCKARRQLKANRLLNKTAEIVLVLAGMAQMRAGQPPDIQEHDLLAEAFRCLGSFLECVQVPPRELLSKKSAEALVQELGLTEHNSPSRDNCKQQADTEEKTAIVACSLLGPGTPAGCTAAEQDANCRRSSSSAEPAATSVVETDNILSLSEGREAPHYGEEQSSSGWPWPDMQDARAVAYRKQLWHAVQQYVGHPTSLGFLDASPSSVSSNSLLSSTAYAYVTPSMACEMCPEMTRDTATVLVCDSCELAFHVKCLEKFNARGLSAGEHYWQCPKCVVRHGGCPQPPAYGPMRPRQQGCHGRLGSDTV